MITPTTPDCSEVLLGVATDVRLVPNPEAIIESFHTEFDALQETFA